MVGDFQGTLVTAASIIAGFGSLVIGFRLERELEPHDKRDARASKQWIPVSDWLIIASTAASMGLVVAPLVASEHPDEATLRLAAAVCSGSAVMVAGYVPAILAHYHFIYGLQRSRSNPTFWEGVFVLVTLALAALAFVRAYG